MGEREWEWGLLGLHSGNKHENSQKKESNSNNNNNYKKWFHTRKCNHNRLKIVNRELIELISTIGKVRVSWMDLVMICSGK